MEAYLVFLLIFSFSLLLIPTHGRSLQKNYSEETIASSQPFFTSNKVEAVSHATYTYRGRTNLSDVLGLITLENAFPQLFRANEDPCLPPRWTWIECNSDTYPRVIALNLNRELLFGYLPDFRTMDALERIDLSDNALFGTIPSFLGTFPHLQELNLAFNAFTGLVPNSLICNKNLDLTLTGNTGLYTSNSCPNSNRRSPPTTTNNNNNDYHTTKRKTDVVLIIVAIIVPIVVAVFVIVGIFLISRHRARTADAIAAASAPPPAPHPPREQEPNLPLRTG